MKKTLAGLGVLALVALGATGVSFPATAATVQPAVEIVAESDAIIASPDVALAHAKPAVATVAAPVAPVERVAPAVAPKAPKARVAAPKAPKAPVCEEDMPCWDCKTMGNLICGPVVPATDPYSGNPIVDCGAQGLITAEDYSCVPPGFYLSHSEVIVPAPDAPELGIPQPIGPDCANLQLGDAWAGVGLACGPIKKGM